MKILFPKNTGQRYYPLHYEYVLAILRRIGAEIGLWIDEPRDQTYFLMMLDGVRFVVDYSDNGEAYDGDLPCLRFHMKFGETRKNIFPFSPGSFWEWDQYAWFCERLKYNAEGVVMHNQRPANNNTDRRNKVRRMVETWADMDRHNEKRVIGTSFDGRELNGASTFYYGCPTTYWKSLKDCLVSIHVPGQNNNMLDSAQFQLMGFGYPTISPNLPEYLPFWRTLEPGVHYIRCADDYSDLTEKLDWCMGHRKELLDIGAQAKKLFQETSTPTAVGKWLEEVVKEVRA